MLFPGGRYGVILWELLTSKEPWHDKTAMQVAAPLSSPRAEPAVPAV